jgi:hypothetical protein
MFYGIRNRQSEKEPTQLDEKERKQIWDSLNKIEKGGLTAFNYCWYRYLEPPYVDWNDRRVLKEMYESADLPSKREENDTLIVKKIGGKLVSAASALDDWFKNPTE